jgi:signal transduction histidine kinase
VAPFLHGVLRPGAWDMTSLQNPDLKWFRQFILQTVGYPTALAIVVGSLLAWQIHHLLLTSQWVDSIDQKIGTATQIQENYSTLQAQLKGHALTRDKRNSYLNYFNQQLSEIIRTEEKNKAAKSQEAESILWMIMSIGIGAFVFGGCLSYWYIRKKCKKLESTYQSTLERVHDSAVAQGEKQSDLRYRAIIDSIKDYTFNFSVDPETVYPESRNESISVVPVHNSEGEIESYVRIIRDLTIQKKAADALRVRTLALTAINSELEALSHFVSHDLRTPLRGIDSLSHSFLEEYGSQLDPTAKDYLQKIRSTSQNMGKLIDDLLNLSLLSQREIHSNQVDLSRIAKKAIQELIRTNPLRKIDIQIAPSIVSQGDSELLSMVLQNLLSNAWKFTEKKDVTEIEFGASTSRGEVVYFVKDNGIGFDMTQSDRLFGAFQRLHPSSEYPGVGMGLATARKIILRHGGNIWFQAKEGQGATFYFTLDQESTVLNQKPLLAENIAS